MMRTRASGNGGSCTGPLRMDEDYAGKVTEKTIERYRAHARVFSDWLADNNLHPEGAGEWGADPAPGRSCLCPGDIPGVCVGGRRLAFGH